MRGEITNVRTLAKLGAFGKPGNLGFYIYGKRRDGRTVPCKNKVLSDGTIQIWSTWFSDTAVEEDMTEFSKDEWSAIQGLPDAEQIALGNRIIRERGG